MQIVPWERNGTRADTKTIVVSKCKMTRDFWHLFKIARQAYRLLHRLQICQTLYR